jgi:uncharacterized protein (TIGR01777 family)
MATIVIAGGSGFLGVSLAEHLLAGGHRVVILSRSVPRLGTGRKGGGEWEHVRWDARTLGGWERALEGADALVNLTGRSVDCIKTPDHQDEILRSRVESTRVLGRAVRALGAGPGVWVQMSTAHIYGDPPELVCDEDSPFGIGLAPAVGRAWEEEFAAAAVASQRKVVLRTSFVIGRDQGAGGGALARLRAVARLGLGGRVGSGKQGMSWIHEEDMNRIFERAIFAGEMRGAYIASSPNPVSQEEFMRTLRRAMGMPVGLPAFEWMVRIGAPLVLRTDPELALYGRYVVPRRLLNEGFEFRHPRLEGAVASLLGAPR